MQFRFAALPLAAVLSAGGVGVNEDPRMEIAAIDTAYQAAVERNDADAMAEVLHEDMILVLGTGENGGVHLSAPS
jgi:hypothetical protein